MRCIKLPGGMQRVTDGDPTVVDEIDVVGEAFDFRSLEIERILGDKD